MERVKLRFSQPWSPEPTISEASTVGNLSSTPLRLLFARRFQFSRLSENPSHFAPIAKP